jgi:hypothetical protein
MSDFEVGLGQARTHFGLANHTRRTATTAPPIRHDRIDDYRIKLSQDLGTLRHTQERGLQYLEGPKILGSGAERFCMEWFLGRIEAFESQFGCQYSWIPWARWASVLCHRWKFGSPL